MSDDIVTIEVDGQTLQARKGSMLIEATDAADIYVPRFCYHDKLTVAANCRMCLVEVEKAPKPLPACATPVMEGMKVQTRSALAVDAQRSTMEFLLINHPLDCPICDQGGECELQDLAMGYGAGVSRYSEHKRVVQDKNIGPLIQTDMTRCIHCTRCVRFGEEIAGLRELGATGRGENMEIGTYVEQTVASELSGNVIDLCPVGALTSKPYRYSARAWELREYPGIAAHDGIGSNIALHAKGNVIKRVVPRENAAINEVWLSDRDRYSYEGLQSSDRLLAPMIKQGDRWIETDWETALSALVDGIKKATDSHGPEELGVLVSPTSTAEELYLAQTLFRGVGVQNIDHRLRQTDFSDQGGAPVYPGLGTAIADLEHIDAALLIGSNVRKDQPLINHRLRKAALRGAALMVVNPVDFAFNWTCSARCVVPPDALVGALARIAKALLPDGAERGAWGDLLTPVRVDDTARTIAEKLTAEANATVLLGNLAQAHPQFAQLRALAGLIAELSDARLGYLGEAANSCGAWLAGAVPHRLAGGAPAPTPGMSAAAMFEQARKAYVLMGMEPEFDCADPVSASRAVRGAEFVAALTAYRTDTLFETANVLLPIAQFAETDGTYINNAGVWQSFDAAVQPPGDARAAWRILRVLGNQIGLTGFDYQSCEDVRNALRAEVADELGSNAGAWTMPTELNLDSGAAVQRITEIPAYAVDPLVRRATALQQTRDGSDEGARVNPVLAETIGLLDGDPVVIEQNGTTATLPLAVDARVPPGCVLVHGAQAAVSNLGAPYGQVSLSKPA